MMRSALFNAAKVVTDEIKVRKVARSTFRQLGLNAVTLEKTWVNPILLRSQNEAPLHGDNKERRENLIAIEVHNKMVAHEQARELRLNAEAAQTPYLELQRLVDLVVEKATFPAFYDAEDIAWFLDALGKLHRALISRDSTVTDDELIDMSLALEEAETEGDEKEQEEFYAATNTVGRALLGLVQARQALKEVPL